MNFRSKSSKKGKPETPPITEGRVSHVEFQATNPDRVNIYIEGKYAFSLAAVLVAERQLKAGVTLSAAEIKTLTSADLYHKGLAAALQQLATRPRSRAEIQQALRRKYPDIAPETSERILNRLSELNYLNDESFARFWVENRSAFSPRGRNLLRQELLQKGVPRDIIDAVVQAHLEEIEEVEESDEFGEEAAANVPTVTREESQALEVARKKAKSYAAEDWQGFYRKLAGFLVRRGYSYGLSGKIVKQVWQELKGQQADSDELDELAYEE